MILVATLVLPGCFATPSKGNKTQVATKKTTKRYKIEQDLGPGRGERIPDLSKIPNAIPKPEPKSRIGNPKQYKVFNKIYAVLPHSKGFKERGTASWYGKKFHGYHTSNGEIYDMYGMSAAHKSLPLPTYVKVKNLNNGKHVIVKVNDRGPFHEDRIIDLSYAAAAKLGILATGTGNVEIEAVDHHTNTAQTYIQVGTFSVEKNAKKLADQLARHVTGLDIAVRKGISKRTKQFHVQIGPFDDEKIISDVTKILQKNKFPKAHKVRIK